VIKCPACRKDIPDDSAECYLCGESLESLNAATRPLREVSLSSGSIGGGRFAPGQMLAGRYRIIDLLGRGGMGEVYRAEDLKLRQAVALKFLPADLASDPSLLERLYHEVSNARDVAHRNVCRVYDVGESDGQHFISMEYVRGEELGSLLKRIGRLPEDKAIQTARQLCAGLAAIHGRGILHRDLKPSNVMLDERGEVRITDFGLAANADDLTGPERMSGTPAYMSPEQLAGAELTEKSDIYSLGLVLYELFTGKRAFDAPSLPELLRLRKRVSTPETPASLVKSLDPLVEQTILRCLEQAPERRPESALQVAAALPGGDPLAAALAMGETPSPEIVAAAAKEGTLRPAVAIICLTAIFIGGGAVLFLAERVKLNRVIPLERSTEVLQQRASEVIRSLGYTSIPKHSAFGWNENQYIGHILNTDQSVGRWQQLGSGEPAVIYFWYRESPRYLVPQRKFINFVEQYDPEMWVSGMTNLDLSPSGKLTYFEVVPPQVEEPPAEVYQPDWQKLFNEAGLDITKFTRTESKWVPPSAYDARAAWEGTYPSRPDIPLRIEAASFRGLPVSFRMIEPWTVPNRMVERPRSTADAISFIVFVTFVLGGIIFGGYLAFRNSRLGRGDRKGAFRLSAFTVVILTIYWVLRASHVPTSQEFNLFAMFAMEATLLSGIFWLFYMSLEPFVRRWWPHRIISWNRLVAGAFRDPLVGRDVLIGCLAGLAFPLSNFFLRLVAGWIGIPPDQPATFAPDTLSGIRIAFAEFLYDGLFNVFFSFGFLFLFLIFYIMFRRRDWLASAAFLAVLTLIVTPLMGPDPRLAVPAAILNAAVMFFVLTRFGLLAFIVMDLVREIFLAFPLTTDISAWYFDITAIAIGLFSALVLYGFYVSLGGQKIFKGELIPD
jgi:hypothetical protein